MLLCFTKAFVYGGAMATDREKMESARAYIKVKDYDSARRLLKQVDHPKAREWESKLPAAPKPKRNYLRIVLVLVIVAGLVFAAIQYAEIRRQATIINDTVERQIITEP